jgi:hypothetical protein
MTDDCEKCGGTGYLTLGFESVHHATMRDCPECSGGDEA